MKPPSLLFSAHGRRPRNARPAFALVIVLVVVSVLALVTVGFLASMSQERATANAFANKARAEESAQAGVDTATGILRDYFKAFPDSATVWDTTQSQNSADTSHPNEGTSLYFRAVPQSSQRRIPRIRHPAHRPMQATANANYTGGNEPE